MQNSGCRVTADGDRFRVKNLLKQSSLSRVGPDAFRAGFRPCYSRSGLRGAIQRFLASPTATWVAIVVAVALAAPSVTTGLSADDWLQRMIARGQHPIAGLPQSRFDLFSFVGHARPDTFLQMDAGVLPWWTDPDVKLAF